MRKTAVSMDADLLAAIKARAAEAGTSVSVWLAEVAADRLRAIGLQEYMDDYRAEFGEFTAEELRAADRDVAQARRAAGEQRRAAS